MSCGKGSVSGTKKRSWRYTPPLPSDNGLRSSEIARPTVTVDSSNSFSQFAFSGILEKLVKEVQSLRTLIADNEHREDVRYNALLNDFRSIKCSLDEINRKLTNFASGSNAKESGAECEVNASNHSNVSNGNSLPRSTEEGDDSVEAELRSIFAGSGDVPISNDQQSVAPMGDVADQLRSPQIEGRAEVKREPDQIGLLLGGLSKNPQIYSHNKSHSTVDTSSSSRSRELLEGNGYRIESTSGVSTRTSRRKRHQTRTTKGGVPPKKGLALSMHSDSEDSSEEGGEKEDDEDEDQPRAKDRVIIKALPTDLPKPTTFRMMTSRGQSKMTDEWKEYALSIYPIRPSQYWDIRKEDYEALIPDRYLEEFAKDPHEKQKNAMIRSIYDWFRYQHRIAQLKVVLSECDIAMDIDTLWEVYVQKMEQRGWPVYGKKLKKCEVTVARKQLLESFLDGTMPGLESF